MNKRQYRGAQIILFILVILFSQKINSQLLNEQTFKFGKLLNYINTLYVDSVNQEELVQKAIIYI